MMKKQTVTPISQRPLKTIQLSVALFSSLVLVAPPSLHAWGLLDKVKEKVVNTVAPSSDDDKTDSDSSTVEDGMEAEETETISVEPLSTLLFSTQKEFPNRAEEFFYYSDYAIHCLDRANVVFLRSAMNFLKDTDQPYPRIADFYEAKKEEKGMFSFLKKEKKEEKDKVGAELVFQKEAYREAMIDAFKSGLLNVKGNVSAEGVERVKEAKKNVETANYLGVVFITSTVPLTNAIRQVKGDIKDKPIDYGLNSIDYVKKFTKATGDIKANTTDYYVFKAQMAGIETVFESLDFVRDVEFDEDDIATYAQNDLDNSATYVDTEDHGQDMDDMIPAGASDDIESPSDEDLEPTEQPKPDDDPKQLDILIVSTEGPKDFSEMSLKKKASESESAAESS